MITRESIEQVLDIAQAEDIVGNFVNLKKRGVNMIGLCPFHDEKTPSFTVSPSKNIYKCFGCGRGGGPVNFVMEHEGYSFPEAIRYVAKMYNIELQETERTAEEDAKALKKDSLFILTEFARDHFRHNLFQTQAGVNIGLAYFKERGFREKTIKEFELGFAPDDYSDMTETAKRKNYNHDYLIELGLSTKNGRDFYRNRVIFPIHNLSGKVIGFGGRALTSDKKTPKYINSIESEVYNKRKILYALNFAKTDIRKEDNCILVEGYTDVISLHQEGIKNVVATSGTSLTPDQIRLIKRYTQNVTVIFDGDAAGINAAMRGMELILAEDLYVKILVLPENHDPDSFLREKGPTVFMEFLKQNANDFILFKTRLLSKDSQNDPIAKVRVLKDIVQTLSKVPDPLARSTYIRECSVILGVDEKVLVNETAKLIKNEIRQRRFKEQQQEERRNDQLIIEDTPGETASRQEQFYTGDSDEILERKLIELIVNFGEKEYDQENSILLIDYLIQETGELIPYMDNSFYQSILTDLIIRRKENKKIGNSFFLQHEDENVRKLAIDLMTSPFHYANWAEKGMELQTQLPPDDNYISEAEQLTIRFYYKKLDKIINENLEKLKEIKPDSDSYIITLKVHQKLLIEKKEIAEKLSNVIN